MEMKDWVRRLSQLNCLRREVDELSQRIAELELQAQGGVGRISGLPRAQRNADRTAEFAVRIAEVRERMECRRIRCMEELGRLYAFIDDVDDSAMRLVLSARYIDGLSWQAVAFRIGETDEQVPRRMHNRLIREKIAAGEIFGGNGKFDENDETNVL